ncbi:hypothetical protein [Mycolicibacterium sp. YH-1]|uniref:hypothetical protein n=1 Tax=Mycolicibacterium sp. YH-1 TaxID=2908837 RepID=UPI001F4C3347|nr:hypothetical protein [Mycolicibacterium sp. YH-1]UNB50773.1 hypothetical protein L0M16_22830 [Mycolicibacterium sp. YH-1]
MSKQSRVFLRGLRLALLHHLSTCGKCKRPYPADPDERSDWLAQTFQGRTFQVICPDCQTPEQVAERENRAATESHDFDDMG